MSERLLIMFDLDGTLVNTVDSIIECANFARMLNKFPRRDTSEIYSKIGLPPSQFFDDLVISDDQLAILIADFRNALNDVNFSSSSLYPGTIKVLEFFKIMQIPLMVATNKPTANAELLLTKTSIRNFFKHVQGSDNLNPKPSPDILLRASGKVNFGRVIMVGDRSEDVLAATAAGFQSIGLAQTFHTKWDLENAGAFLVFNGMQEFANTLDIAFFKDRILI